MRQMLLDTKVGMAHHMSIFNIHLQGDVLQQDIQHTQVLHQQ